MIENLRLVFDKKDHYNKITNYHTGDQYGKEGKSSTILYASY